MDKLAIQSVSQTGVETLDKDLGVLIGSVTSVQESATHLDSNLKSLEGYLSITSVILSDLSKVTNIIKDVRKLMNAASVIPQIRTETKNFIKGLDKILPILKDAQVGLKSVDKKIEPLRDEVNKIEKKVSDFKDKVKDLNHELVVLRGQFERADNCISDLPDGKLKHQLLDKLNKLADAVDVPVNKLNTEISKVDKAFTTMLDMIQTRIDAQAKVLDLIAHDLNDLDTALTKLVKPLNKLAALLRRNFTVKIPYPCTKIVCEYELRISGDIIVRGINKIEKAIEKKLEGAVLKAAKAIGIKHLVKDLIDDYNHAFDIIVKQLHLDFKIDVPGLDNLEDTADSVRQAVVKILGQFSLDMESFNKEVNNISNAYKKAHKIYTDCTECSQH